MQFPIPSVSALPEVAQAVLAALGTPRKIALYGEMGAGKTTFVRAFCAALGVQTTTASPTFSLINEYRYTDANGQAALLHHLDLYRLQSAQEAFDIGIEDVLYDPWWCLIEWPQVIEQVLLPEDAVRIDIQVISETERMLIIHQ